MDIKNVSDEVTLQSRKSNFKAAGRIALKSLYFLILAVLVLIIAFNLIILVKTYFFKNKSPDILGFTPLAILSSSMTPKINYGDLIITKDVNPTSLKKGDVIAYRESDNILISHRIIDIAKDNGSVVFLTKGDANNVADSALVSTKQVVGKSILTLPFAGYISIFGSTPQGRAVLIMAPIMLFIAIIEAIKLVKKARKKFRILKIKN